MRCAGLAACAVLLALLAGCGNDSGKPKAPEAGPPAPQTTPPVTDVGANGGRTQIGFIVPGGDAEGWRAIHAGANKAIGEMKKGPDGKPVIDLLWEDSGSDGAAQVRSAQKLVKNGIAAIVVSPDSAAALTGVTEAAAAQRVPVIALDSAFGDAGCKCAISFDDAKGTELAVRALGDVKGGAWVIYPAGKDLEASLRAQAFRAGAVSSVVKIVPPEQTAEALDSLAKGNGGGGESAVTAIFAPDESSTAAALKQLEEAQLAGKVALVGVGASPRLTAALQSNEIRELIVGDYSGAGYSAVKTAGDCIREKKVDKRVVIPVYSVTAKNMGDPEIAPLLNVPAEKGTGAR